MRQATNTQLATDQEQATIVTIVDVANLAGVSIKTVSRVANGEPHVRETTRRRVQQAIDQLGYKANPYARYLSSLRSKVTAVSPATHLESGRPTPSPTR
ncbi:MAG: LacI family DNA-binding transcriptional regulator [Gammaproteobacteria bacterium]